jgi:hypothetical protein
MHMSFFKGLIRWFTIATSTLEEGYLQGWQSLDISIPLGAIPLCDVLSLDM